VSPAWTQAATTAPTIGASTYSHASASLPVAIIGPRARAGFEGRTRQSPAHDDVEGQGHSDREGGEIAGATGDRRVEHDRD
jgi:hypothetical protein